MRIATMTWYHYRNYGTVLQAAALAQTLKKLGHEPTMIAYRPRGYYRTLPDYGFSALSKRVVRRVLRNDLSIQHAHFCSAEKDALFDAFLSEHLSFTGPCRTKTDLELLEAQFDAFLCGSDQIWSPLTFDPHYFLDFVHVPGKKIAYAPSFGVKSIADTYVQRQMKKLLSDFSQLSVREIDGQRLLKELIGRKSEVVLDPTLLLSAKDWEIHFHVQTSQKNVPYLLVYMLGCNDDHWQRIYQTAEHLGLEMRIIPVFEADAERKGCIQQPIGPQEFLSLFHDAAYVCTDSYHGLIFSILFHKRFTGFCRFEKHDPGNQNSRVFHLLDALSLRDRLLTGVHNQRPEDADIDFSFVDSCLAELRQQSFMYLNDALASAAQETPYRAVRVMQQNSLCCGCGACRVICPVSAITVEENENGFFSAKVNTEKCVSCSKCLTVCPMCTPGKSRAAEAARLYAFQSSNPDVLMHSTSGGAAYSIAEYLLSAGCVIAGCTFDVQKQQARHVLVYAQEALRQLQGSKYLPSYFPDALDQIQSSGMRTAIFGTPCQIAAARRVLGQRENVYYIDLVCHGVPSYHLYRKYQQFLNGRYGLNTEHMQMIFRHKPSGWRQIHLYATDGQKEYCCDKTQDPFFRMFEIGNCYMESCYDCRWRVHSEADVRLGDYWGPRFESDSHGVNMAVCFTVRGEALMQQVSAAGYGCLNAYPVEDYLSFQQSENLPKPVFYDALMTALRHEHVEIDKIIRKYAVPLESGKMSKMEHVQYILQMMMDKET